MELICVLLALRVQGSHVYLERAGDLELLLAEEDQARGTVHCFSLAEGALFVEAVPQTDISRRITAFQYELVPSRGPGAHMYPYLLPGLGKRVHAPVLLSICLLTCRIKRCSLTCIELPLKSVETCATRKCPAEFCLVMFCLMLNVFFLLRASF